MQRSTTLETVPAGPHARREIIEQARVALGHIILMVWLLMVKISLTVMTYSHLKSYRGS